MRDFFAGRIRNKIRYHSTALHFIENGQRQPSISTAKKIAQTLDFDWKLFFEYNKSEALVGKWHKK
ncbi:MAG: helix-turn-helix transcriptional regulator [Defluviitaleaceae bacterium]|nr:helix-turn-helix transcriptional regulator [Defluviitaleaceae bacterium]